MPVRSAACAFLTLVSYLQRVFTCPPRGLGFRTEPLWRLLPVLAVGGVPAAPTILTCWQLAGLPETPPAAPVTSTSSQGHSSASPGV